MNTVLLLLGVAASDAIADLWRIVSRGPASMTRLIGRLLGEAAYRLVGLTAWVTLTALVASWRISDGAGSGGAAVDRAELWATVAVGLTPLLFSGVSIAPHIGPVIYIGLHVWTVVRLFSRLTVVGGLSVIDGALAVGAGAAGYWLCRWARRLFSLRGRRLAYAS